MSYYDSDEDRADFHLAQAGELRCGLCNEPADRVVRCGGDNCLAQVGGCCLSVDGLCGECAIEATRRRRRDHHQTAMWLKQLATELGRGWTSDAIAIAADRLVERWRADVKEEQR